MVTVDRIVSSGTAVSSRADNTHISVQAYDATGRPVEAAVCVGGQCSTDQKRGRSAASYIDARVQTVDFCNASDRPNRKLSAAVRVAATNQTFSFHLPKPLAQTVHLARRRGELTAIVSLDRSPDRFLAWVGNFAAGANPRVLWVSTRAEPGPNRRSFSVDVPDRATSKCASDCRLVTQAAVVEQHGALLEVTEARAHTVLLSRRTGP